MLSEKRGHDENLLQPLFLRERLELAISQANLDLHIVQFFHLTERSNL